MLVSALFLSLSLLSQVFHRINGNNLHANLRKDEIPKFTTSRSGNLVGSMGRSLYMACDRPSSQWIIFHKGQSHGNSHFEKTKEEKFPKLPQARVGIPDHLTWFVNSKREMYL